jgi:hypothetical protein
MKNAQQRRASNLNPAAVEIIDAQENSRWTLLPRDATHWRYIYGRDEDRIVGVEIGKQVGW